MTDFVVNHLGQKITVGTFVIWPVVSGSSVDYNYGKLAKVVAKPNGSGHAVIAIPASYGGQIKVRNQACKRTDLLMPIEPRLAKRVMALLEEKGYINSSLLQRELGKVPVSSF